MTQRDLHVKPAAKATEPAQKPIPELNKCSSKLDWRYSASADGMDSNLLIFLHGLGDTHQPFYNLGQSLKLPQTAILSLRAPEHVPLLPEEAYQWYTSFDELGELISKPNPTAALDLIKRIIMYLHKECGWPAHALHFFGFAQGGSIAAESVLALSTDNADPLSLGSLVTVDGPLLSFPTPSALSPTPILVWRKASNSITAAGPFKKGFKSVGEHTAQGIGQGMPSNQAEWFPIMK